MVLHTEGTVAPGAADGFENTAFIDPYPTTVSIHYSSNSTSSEQNWNPTGAGEFVKRMTTIAQVGATNTTSGEYFGIDPATLNGSPSPKVGWYGFNIGTNYGTSNVTSVLWDATNGSADEYPKDTTRVIWQYYSNSVGFDKLEGLYMHT